MSETRQIAPILVADIVGYRRLAGVDEDRILARLRAPAQRSDRSDHRLASWSCGQAHRRRQPHRVSQRRRRRALSHQGAERPHRTQRGLSQERRIEFRVGIHLGNFVEKVDGDLMGDIVSINVG
jgi:adenylate cyclase